MNIERAEHPAEVVEGRRTVVTALPLKAPARQRLADLTGARVLDIREPVERADLVLTPSCSPQLIGALRAKYDGAQVVVVELDDWDMDIALPGPVKRILRGGASAYVLADSIDELAAKLAVRTNDGGAAEDATEVHELTTASTVDDVIAAFLRESVEYATRLRTDDD